MIRNATKDDIESINKLGSTINHNFLNTYDISSYIDQSNYILLVSENEEFEGFLLISVNYDSYELEMIIVDEKYRNNGVGSNLICTFVKNYAKIGNAIFLEVSVNNNTAIEFYKKHGFSPVNIRKNYYDHKTDAYVMKKVIN